MGEVKPSPKIFEHQGFPCPEDDFGHPRLVWAGQPGGTFLRQQKGHGAHTTAKHSPSTGAYRDSASLVNLDPASTTCQPPLQQYGLMSSHEHLFCVRRNPIPVLQKSGIKHVHSPGLKHFMPSLIESTMTTFDSSKSRVRFSSQ